jgi:hypothetical protein
MVLPPRATRRVLPLIALCGLLAACGSSSGQDIASPHTRHYGVNGAGFSIAASPPLGEQVAFGTKGSEWWSKSTVVQSFLALLPTSATVDSLLNHRHNPNGTFFTLQGHRAVEDIGSCSTPSGACPGKVGNLAVLDGATVYLVTTEGLDASSTQRILSSFHIDG